VHLLFVDFKIDSANNRNYSFPVNRICLWDTVLKFHHAGCITGLLSGCLRSTGTKCTSPLVQSEKGNSRIAALVDDGGGYEC
jgi:hypothetical protein